MSQTFEYDLLIVGGGHAGVEAAFVGARRGHPTALLTMLWDNIGQMSCNPAIGGSAKGQVVREIDALGGEMGKAIDATGIQFRMLNKSKGPAVWAPRAQADRELYARDMQERVRCQPLLDVHEELVEDLLVEEGRAIGLVCASGNIFRGKTVILATGTFLKGLMHTGSAKTVGGRVGEQAANRLSQTLLDAGFQLGRLKTGTPPRVARESIDFSQMEVQEGDLPAPVFSFTTTEITRPQIKCYLSYTNDRTHRLLLDNLDASPMYSGQIQAVGPRYCPSVEDKVVRFKDKPMHQIILEPESLSTNVMYVNGFSTGMPKGIQDEAIRTIPGYQDVEIIRYGYAVEYDYIPPIQLKPWLESKPIAGLFLAGQINGTSGYEEAAAQGLMAAINAVQQIRGQDYFILDRSDAYIGVMIDDLVTKEIQEPYRLLTSRAEYRLQLRQDNADLRLTPYGRQYDLIEDERWETFEQKRKDIECGHREVKATTILPGEVNPLLKCRGSKPITSKIPLHDIAKRPQVELMDFKTMGFLADVSDEALFQVNLDVKYKGYIERQNREIQRYRQLEKQRIPDNFDYDQVKGFSNEARAKLRAITPASIGQAGRIDGVTPADISVLLVALETYHRHKAR